MTNSVGPDQTAPIGAVCSGSTLFASILNSLVMLGNYLQQMTSADDSFRCIFLGALRVKMFIPSIDTLVFILYSAASQPSEPTPSLILTLKAPTTTKVVCFCSLLNVLEASSANSVYQDQNDPVDV